MKYDFNLSMAKYGRYWKSGRKITDHNLRQSAAMAYRPMQTRKVADFLRKLVQTPDHVFDHIRQSVPIYIPTTSLFSPICKLAVSLRPLSCRSLTGLKLQTPTTDM